jgi:hypothetical protein
MYETAALPAVLYGREIWYLTVKSEYILRVSHNKMLRTFGPKREQVTQV